MHSPRVGRDLGPAPHTTRNGRTRGNEPAPRGRLPRTGELFFRTQQRGIVCTLAVAWRAFADRPVVAVGTRDESFDRPSEPPAVREWDSRTVAPLDARAEGTWIGANEGGVFAAITNRWTDGEPTGERSRGLLVRDALSQTSAEAAARTIESELEARSYAGFNLVVADATAAVLIEHGARTAVRPLEPGVHVIVNVGADGRYEIPSDRAEPGRERATSGDRIGQALRPEPGETGGEWRARAEETLADHDYGACVHGDGFGTRSATSIVVGEGGLGCRHAPGPPCRTAFEPVAANDQF